MVWALDYFRSWRFRAKLDEGHQLATGGPFRLLRHPIYMGLNLLALGSAFWVVKRELKTEKREALVQAIARDQVNAISIYLSARDLNRRCRDCGSPNRG